MTETINQVTVTCTSDSLLIRISNISTEPPTVEWNFCGKIINNNDDERVQIDTVCKEGNTNYEAILRINKVTAQDFGEYTCILKNGSMQIKKKIRITQQFMEQITGESETSKDGIKVKKIQKRTEKAVDGSQEQAEGVKSEKKIKKTKRKMSDTQKQQNGNSTEMAKQKTETNVPTADTDKKHSASDGTMIPNSDASKESVSLPATATRNTDPVQKLPENLQMNLSDSKDCISDATLKRDARRPTGTCEELYVSQINSEPENCQPLPAQHLRLRRMSTIDFSRSAQRFSRMASWSLHLSGADSSMTPLIDQVYSNPEMEIFRQRRLSQQMTRRRNSLADLIPDWPTLEYIEKPEYRMPEFKEDAPAESQTLELRKMDPATIFKANHWIEELQEKACQEKETKVELVCRYSERNVKPQWFKNTLEIFHGHKYNFLSDDGLFRLVIQRVARQDSGKYTCQADDKQTSAYLTVREKKIEYHFVQKLPARSTVKEKQNLILECMLSDPRPMVIWSKNGETVEDTPEMFEISRRENRCILQMKNVKRDLDGAEFSCEVYGDKTACRITVEEPEYKFVRHLPVNDVDSYENETSVSEREINYDDVPDLKWFHQDSVGMVHPKDTYAIIPDLLEGRDYEFRVCAVNEDGQGEFSFPSPALHTKATRDHHEALPRFLRKPHNCLVDEGSVANFKCQIASPSAPTITWFFKGSALNTGIKYMPKYSGNIYELRIKRIKLADEGEYTVMAENAYGRASATASLNVDYKTIRSGCMRSRSVEPTSTVTRRKLLTDMRRFQEVSESLPSFSFPLRDRLIQEGIGVKLIACVDGLPRPKIQWLKAGEALMNGEKYIIVNSFGVCSLEIICCQLHDRGNYVCRATNVKGSVETSCFVTVVA